jgi:hypothetical protein
LEGDVTKIKNCPFCDKPPETMPSGENGRGLMIQCITPGCVNPHTSYYDHDSAIRAWNTRAPQTTSALSGYAKLANADVDVERAAEAMWQTESARAASRPRKIAWEDENVGERARWRQLASVAIQSSMERT